MYPEAKLDLMQQLTEECPYNQLQSLLVLSPVKTLQWLSIASRVITKLFSIPHFSLIILVSTTIETHTQYMLTHAYTHIYTS